MTSITIRHVPEQVRNELAARAAQAGQSLQEFMLAELTKLTSRPTVAELVTDLRRRKRRSGREFDRAAMLADRDADRR